MAADLVSRGNDEFVNENYQNALELYTEAINAEPNRDDVLCHRAQTYIKLQQYKEAEEDSEKAVEINQKNSKAFLRKGTALFHQEKYSAAKECLTRGLSLNPGDNNMKTLLRKCEAEIDLSRAEQPEKNSQKVVVGTSSVEASIPNSIAVEPSPQTSTTNSVVADSTPRDMDTSSVVVDVPVPAKKRYDWYQTETMVVITVMIKKVQKEDCHIDIQEQHISVCIKLPSESDYTLEMDLAHKIIPEKSLYKIMSTKVEIKMRKEEGARWTKLEDDGVKEPQPVKQTQVTSDADDVNRYPSSSHYTRNWDKLVTNITAEEKEEKQEGDAALNNLFQKIYGDGSDETKKAMMKSFYESGGTVLSTNWKEVGEKKVDVKPPDGMEFKKWES